MHYNVRIDICQIPLGGICRSQTKTSCVKSLLMLFDYPELDSVCLVQLWSARRSLADLVN